MTPPRRSPKPGWARYCFSLCSAPGGEKDGDGPCSPAELLPTSRGFCCRCRGEGLCLGPWQSPRGLQSAWPALLPKHGMSPCSSGQEPRCSSSSSCFEAAGAGSFPHGSPAAPHQLDLQAISCEQETLGHSPPISFSAAEVQELRRETGKIRARSATPCNPTLVARAALRLPCCCPGTGPCVSLTIPSPMDQLLLSLNSTGRSDATNSWKAIGFHHPSKCHLEALRQHRDDALPQGPELLSNSPHHGKDKVSPGGAKGSPPTTAARAPQPNTSHLAGTSSQTSSRELLQTQGTSSCGCCAPAQLPHAPLCLSSSQSLTNHISASTPADLGCNFKPNLFATAITGL